MMSENQIRVKQKIIELFFAKDENSASFVKQPNKIITAIVQVFWNKRSIYKCITLEI